MIILAAFALLSLLAGYIFTSVHAASDLEDVFVYTFSMLRKINKDGTQTISEGKRRKTFEKRKLTVQEKRRAFMLMSWSLIPAMIFTVLYILGVR